MAREKLHSPMMDYLNVAADAGIFPHELPKDVTTMSDEELRKGIKHFKKLRRREP